MPFLKTLEHSTEKQFFTINFTHSTQNGICIFHMMRALFHVMQERRGVGRLDLMVGQNTSLVTYVLLTTQHADSYVRLLRVVVRKCTV